MLYRNPNIHINEPTQPNYLTCFIQSTPCLNVALTLVCLSVSVDTYIQKTKKLYIDSRARRNLGNINTELQDVQRIMVANIEEVLQRGEALSGEASPPIQTDVSSFEGCLVVLILSSRSLLRAALDSKASNLSSLSKKYRSDAKYLNTRSTYAKLAAGGVFFIMLIVYVRFWWL